MGLGRNLDRSLKEKKKNLRERQRKRRLGTYRNTGERENVIIITGHHIHHIRNLKGGSASNTRDPVKHVTHVVINKSGSRGGVGHWLKEGSEGLKGEKKTEGIRCCGQLEPSASRTDRALD